MHPENTAPFRGVWFGSGIMRLIGRRECDNDGMLFCWTASLHAPVFEEGASSRKHRAREQWW